MSYYRRRYPADLQQFWFGFTAGSMVGMVAITALVLLGTHFGLQIRGI